MGRRTQTLGDRVNELKRLIDSEKESSINVDRFLSLVCKYTDIKELTAEIIREFVEKVYVHQMERINGKKVQRIRIVSWIPATHNEDGGLKPSFS